MRRTLAALVSGLLVALACGGLASARTITAQTSTVRTNTTQTNTTAAAASPAGLHVPVTPFRVLDTYRSLGSAPIAAGRAGSVRVTGVGGVPASGVVAVIVTITASRPKAGGYVTVYPSGTARPATSNINFIAGDSQADAVYARVGADGRIAIYNGSSGAVRLIGDVTGYFRAASGSPGGAFVATTPTRIYDTRGASALGARVTRQVPVLGHGGVPGTGVSAVVATVTAVYPGKGGYLSVLGDYGPAARDRTSNVDFAARHTVGNLVISPVGSDGYVRVINGSDATVGLIVDIQGYFLAGTPTVDGSFQTVLPQRLYKQVALKAGATQPVSRTASTDPVPSEYDVLNVTVSGVRADGFAVAYPTATRPSLVSSLSLTAGRVSTGLVSVPRYLSYLYNGSGGGVSVTVDRYGYYLRAPGSIRGTVRDATSGSALAGVRVFAYHQLTEPDADERYFEQIAQTVTSATGQYAFPTLASNLRYNVCVDPTSIDGPDRSTGYLARCYRDEPFAPGVQPRLDDPAVTVSPGGVTAVDQSLPRTPTGTITGHITTTGGTPLEGVQVQLFGNQGQLVPYAQVPTDANGAYTVHFAAGTYRVCFDPGEAVGHPGLSSVCEQAPRQVEVGHTLVLDRQLFRPGRITGTVTAASGAILDNATVLLRSEQGSPLLSEPIDEHGHYTFAVDTGTYQVCFSASGDRNDPYGYLPQCFDEVAEGGHATPVVVTDDGTTTANATLAPAGAVAGTVTDARNGAALSNVGVYVFRSGGPALDGIGETYTDAGGKYQIDGLKPSKGGYVICFDPGLVPSPDGQHQYAGQCFDGQGWDVTSGVIPAGSSPVPVAVAARRGGIDATLTFQ